MTPTPRSSSCTPRTTAGWCGSRCCSCATRRPPRRSSRTRSWRCTAAGAGCGPRQGARLPAPDRRQPVPLGAAAPRGPSPARRAAPTRRPARRGRRRGRPRAARRDACSTRCSTCPTRQREVLALRYYLDLDEAEIADDARHQPRRGQEPRLPRRRRPARPARPLTRTTMTDPRPDRRRAARPARGRRRRRRARPTPWTTIRARTKVTPMTDQRRPWSTAPSAPSPPPPPPWSRSPCSATTTPTAADRPRGLASQPRRRRPPSGRAAGADRGHAAAEPTTDDGEPARCATTARAGLLRRRHPAGPRLFREFHRGRRRSTPLSEALDEAVADATRSTRLPHAVAGSGATVVGTHRRSTWARRSSSDVAGARRCATGRPA